jgi:hypothetical protein
MAFIRKLKVIDFDYQFVMFYRVFGDYAFSFRKCVFVFLTIKKGFYSFSYNAEILYREMSRIFSPTNILFSVC